MGIEFRLRDLLQRHGLEKASNFIQIERDVGIARKVVSGLYYNRRVGITFNQLERLCRWLHNKGVTEGLPGALFGYQPSGLVNALTAADLVRIYVGEYFQHQASDIPKFWVSWADSEVASLFFALLSGPQTAEGEPADGEAAEGESADGEAAEGESADGEASDGEPAGSKPLPGGRKGVRFEYVHVPSQDAPFAEASEVGRRKTEPTEPARLIFRAMREDRSPTTNILIGSQRANLLVELFVAELLGREAFTDARGRLPFYLYRDSSPPSLIPSCFGGSELPADCPGPGRSGIYYRQDPKRWEFCPSIPNEADAGIVIVRRVPGQGQTELAVFGYSAQATRAMGELLHRAPDQFWGPLERLKGGIEARVYVCRISMREAAEVTGLRPRSVLDTAEVYPLELQALATARKPRRRR
jgi:DNA-binding Xre family transcriptional regulator